MRELSLNIMDIVQNSISAQSSLIEIHLHESVPGHRLTIDIIDNGRGMTEGQLKDVQSPFYTTRTTRSVGLGVPLFKMAAEMTGGEFRIDSVVGEGTTVTAKFDTSHIDMIPPGDVAETILLLITCNPDTDFVYLREKDERSLRLDTREMREILGKDVPLNSPDVAQWLREYLREQEDALA